MNEQKDRAKRARPENGKKDKKNEEELFCQGIPEKGHDFRVEISGGVEADIVGTGGTDHG
jgi:hypothetical protein